MTSWACSVFTLSIMERTPAHHGPATKTSKTRLSGLSVLPGAMLEGLQPTLRIEMHCETFNLHILHEAQAAISCAACLHEPAVLGLRALLSRQRPKENLRHVLTDALIPLVKTDFGSSGRMPYLECTSSWYAHAPSCISRLTQCFQSVEQHLPGSKLDHRKS